MCQDLKKFHVNTLVRVCDATYDKAPVEKEGIQVVVSAETPVILCWLYFFCFSPTTYTFFPPPTSVLSLGLAFRWWCPSSESDCGRLAQAAQHQVSRGTWLLHCCALCGRAWAVSDLLNPLLWKCDSGSQCRSSHSSSRYLIFQGQQTCLHLDS